VFEQNLLLEALERSTTSRGACLAM